MFYAPTPLSIAKTTRTRSTVFKKRTISNITTFQAITAQTSYSNSLTIPLIQIHVWVSQSYLLIQRYTPELNAPLVYRVASVSRLLAEGWTPAKDRTHSEASPPLTHSTNPKCQAIVLLGKSVEACQKSETESKQNDTGWIIRCLQCRNSHSTYFFRLYLEMRRRAAK